MQFRHIVLGGTFDHIHKGHEALLTKALALGKCVTIGLTSDAYVSNVKSKNVQSHAVREKNLIIWLKDRGALTRTTIVPIDDSYGPSISSSPIPHTPYPFDAIVVSEETEKVAKKINRERKKLHLPPLSIIVVQMIPAEDTEAISSTRIRNGEIDHKGKLILPEALRRTLTKPIGTIIPDGTSIISSLIPHPSSLITVGDTTTAAFLTQGIVPTLACIDFQVRRQAFDWEKEQWQKLTKGRRIAYFSSGPGFISQDVMKAIKRWSEQPNQTLFIIHGEEDLLVLPAILYAPHGTVVYYGQPASSNASQGGPDHGIVQVDVTTKTKQLAQQLLSQFT